MYNATKTFRPLMLALALSALGASAVQAAPSDFFRVVNVAQRDMLNVRSGPSTHYPRVSAIPFNGRTILATGREQGKWVEVNWGGTTGWVHRKFISRIKAPAQARPVAAVVPAPAPRPVAAAPSRKPVLKVNTDHWRDTYRYENMDAAVQPKFKPTNKYRVLVKQH
ncbi:MAG: hypothetical protein CR991_03345 [Proteobacteria bacterium]|nr:MAG: hypothetical protein CR991_03345 [Pseudomonadota bacterium]